LARFGARGLTVRYATIKALSSLDLEVASGEIFVLLGGSGSGKTTLLRCAGGFLAPAAGRIFLDDDDVTGLPPHARPVNTMFQSYALFPHLNVAQNIGFGLRGLDRARRRARVAELLDLVRLAGFERRRVTELSGGQQQRVALARSVAPRPKLLLLDEPFSALDRALRDATRGEFLALVRQTGITTILVTHDQDEALTSADRIGVLERGRLAQVGTPASLYERPASRFVASFLGAANLLEGTVVPDSDKRWLRIALPGGIIRAIGSAPSGARVTLALRPERIRLQNGIGENCLTGVVERATYRGAALDVVVRLPEDVRLRASQPLTDGLMEIPAPGSVATLSWTPEAAVVLSE
jgi:ABC-type Fe3+/spermidine/putrescine transport system ATPase subunit